MSSNILKFKKNRRLNIGLIIFGIIFIYLVATIVMYITAPHITVYEVRQGSILKDTAYTGLAIRNEVVVHATEGGYINYYVQDSSKVKVGSGIYTLSEQKLVFDEEVSEDEQELSDEEERAIAYKIQHFNHDYDEANFSDTYRFKDEIKNSIGTLSEQERLKQLPTDVSVYPASEDGVVVCSVDEMEGLTVETASLEHLDKTDYKKTKFANNTEIKPGDPVYKIITDDKWTLMLELNQDTVSVLQDKKDVKVHFKKDDQTLWASFSMTEINGHFIGYLTFPNAMIRYATERYLDVELILEDEKGLKIPKTAETEKEFYVVPRTYITQGGNSSNSGVLLQTLDANKNIITAFKEVNIYYEDEEVVYLDPNQFEETDIILKPESNETFQLEEKRTLKGVYCINKGYAMFKQIHILCESDSYYIVEEGNSYGLSNYDHIALDSTNIKENDIVF